MKFHPVKKILHHKPIHLFTDTQLHKTHTHINCKKMQSGHLEEDFSSLHLVHFLICVNVDIRIYARIGSLCIHRLHCMTSVDQLGSVSYTFL